METQTTFKKPTQTTEERLESLLQVLLDQDIDQLIPDTAQAYMLLSNQLTGLDMEDEIYSFNNVVDFLVILKDIKAEYGNQVKISLRKEES